MDLVHFICYAHHYAELTCRCWSFGFRSLLLFSCELERTWPSPFAYSLPSPYSATALGSMLIDYVYVALQWKKNTLKQFVVFNYFWLLQLLLRQQSRDGTLVGILCSRLIKTNKQTTLQIVNTGLTRIKWLIKFPLLMG